MTGMLASRTSAQIVVIRTRLAVNCIVGFITLRTFHFLEEVVALPLHAFARANPSV